MTKFIEIQERLKVINALETIKLRIESHRKDGTYELESYRFYNDSSDQYLLKEFLKIYESRGEKGGKLIEDINKINDFIRQTLQPHIDEQKELIKKLL